MPHSAAASSAPQQNATDPGYDLMPNHPTRYWSQVSGLPLLPSHGAEAVAPAVEREDGEDVGGRREARVRGAREPAARRAREMTGTKSKVTRVQIDSAF